MSDFYTLHVADADTLPLVARLAGHVHGPGVETLTLALSSFPDPVHVLWVKHEPSGEAVSTLTLIPWTWRLGHTRFTAWETGIVATDEAHRGRGLGSRLMAWAETRRREAGVAASIIQGIPYFYRRYEYEFAAPLETHLEWELRRLPALPAGWTARPVQLDDVGLLDSWLGEDHHDAGACRRVEHWQFRLGPARGTDTETDFELVVDPQGRPRGVFGLAKAGFGDGLIVNEVGGDPEAWPALVALCGHRAVTRKKPFVRLHLGDQHPLARWSQRHGARATGSWHWQVRFDDPAATLRTLAPELVRRWPTDLPRRLILDLYRGSPVVLEGPGVDGEARLSVPPELLPPLVFGWRPWRLWRELRPDLSGDEEGLALGEALFAPRSAFFGSPY